MKVAIVINTSWNIYNFRLGLVRQLLRKGHEVFAIAPEDAYSQKLVDEGCQFHSLPMSGSGMNPLKDLELMFRLMKILRKTRPDIILTYTIKPNIYASLISSIIRVPVICNVSGLGTVFLWKGYVREIAVKLYSLAFRFSSWVFFQNEDDQRDFIKQVSVKREKTSVIPGSGVDTDHFQPATQESGDPTCFLMISRLLIDKGVYDYIDAIKILQVHGERARFVLVGSLDETHSRSIKRSELETWIKDELIEYHDHVEDIRLHLREAEVVVLPSYREGTPKTLLEAGAMGKAMIATNVPGCKQVVLDGETGFLCKLKKPNDLAAKMKLYLTLSMEERKEMSRKARESIVNRYDQKLVIDQYLSKIEELIKPV